MSRDLERLRFEAVELVSTALTETPGRQALVLTFKTMNRPAWEVIVELPHGITAQVAITRLESLAQAVRGSLIEHAVKQTGRSYNWRN